MSSAMTARKRMAKAMASVEDEKRTSGVIEGAPLCVHCGRPIATLRKPVPRSKRCFVCRIDWVIERKREWEPYD